MTPLDEDEVAAQLALRLKGWEDAREAQGALPVLYWDPFTDEDSFYGYPLKRLLVPASNIPPRMSFKLFSQLAWTAGDPEGMDLRLLGEYLSPRMVQHLTRVKLRRDLPGLFYSLLWSIGTSPGHEISVSSQEWRVTSEAATFGIHSNGRGSFFAHLRGDPLAVLTESPGEYMERKEHRYNTRDRWLRKLYRHALTKGALVAKTLLALHLGGRTMDWEKFLKSTNQ